MSEFTVDLNSDVGESFGAFTIGNDDAVMRSVTSVNVAAGFHGGDPRTMDTVIGVAQDRGIGVGAHPGFPDLIGFGRRDMRLSFNEIRTDMIYQIGAVAAFCRAHGATLRHVKPHGQLNNMAVVNEQMAEAIVAGVVAFDPSLILVSYGGCLTEAGKAAGLPIASEVFADRAYTDEGRLVSRSQPNAVISDVAEVVGRAVSMVRDGMVESVNGKALSVRADTICIHGDTADAPEIARQLRAALEEASINVRPLEIRS